MTNYVWFQIKPSGDAVDFSSLSPENLVIDELSSGVKAYRFATEASHADIAQWPHTNHWQSFSWPNQCMFYPANLGYSMTLEGFNNFVRCYARTYSHVYLEDLEASPPA